MNLTTQKRIAAELLKCGVTRVRVKEDKEVDDALTREDIRNLIKKKMIWKIQKKGTSRVKARVILKQKSRGRRRGDGSKKGKVVKKKEKWMSLIRAQRKTLMELRETGKLKREDYRTLYMRAKGGMFRNKKHMLSYMKDKDLIKIKTPAKKVTKKVTKKAK